MQNKIRWGIIGCGKIANKFASDLLLSTTSQLYACASRNSENAITFAQKYHIRHYFTEYIDLVKCAEVDAIYIATPHSHHFEHASLCLHNRKSVLCEKPLTVNHLLASKLIELAKNNNCLLVEAMWTAFLPAIQEIKEKISSGSIGEIRHIKADFGFKSLFDPDSRLFNPDLAGGALLDIGIYPLFISLFFLGVPESVIATAHLADTGVDSECTVMLKYKNGATAVLYSSININTDTKCEVFGTEGKITIPTRFHEQGQYIIKKDDSESALFIKDKMGFGYCHEIEHFNACISEGLKESPVMPFSLSLDMIQLMDEIRKQTGVKYKYD